MGGKRLLARGSNEPRRREFAVPGGRVVRGSLRLLPEGVPLKRERKYREHISEGIDKCISLLDELAKDPARFATLPEEQRIALLKAAGELSRPDRAEAKKRNKAAKKARSLALLEDDRRAKNSTGIRSAREDATFKAPPRIEFDPSGAAKRGGTIHAPRNCYVCKEAFTDLHFFYDALCKKCGDLNYRKRFQTAPLRGQVALITGARVKIGYQAALMMLRGGTGCTFTVSISGISRAWSCLPATWNSGTDASTS